MILGIGTDIVKVSRFDSWFCDVKKIERFFNKNEMIQKEVRQSIFSQHYSARFAAKEAFAKALGTGFRGFDTKDVYITHDDSGKPLLNVENNAENLLKERFGNCNIHVSLSHENEYAVAFVIIETA